VGCLDTVAFVLKIHLLCLLRRPREGTVLARAVVRLLCTQEPAPKEDDSWAQAPASEIGLLVLAEVKRRTTAGGGVLLMRRFALSAHGGQRPKSMTRGPRPPCQRLGQCFRRRRRGATVCLLHTRRPTPKENDSWAQAPVSGAGPLLSVGMKRRSDSLLAWRFAFFVPGDQRTSCMTCGAGPPRHRLGTPVCIGGDFLWRFEARARESAFKKGFIPRVAAIPSLLSYSLCPFAFELSAPLCLRGLCFASP
jgi:hypothetical protein